MDVIKSYLRKVNLAYQSILVSAITFFNSALSFVAQLLIAREFGAGIEVDAYIFALSSPIFIAGLINGLINYTLIPKLVKMEKNVIEYSEYTRAIMERILLSASLFWVAGILFGGLLVRSIATEKIQRFNDFNMLLTLTWSIATGQIVQSLLLSILNARRNHLVAAVINGLPAIGIIGILSVVVAIGRNPTIVWVPTGMLVGLAISIAIAFKILKIQVFPLSFDRKILSNFGQDIKPVVFSLMGMSVFTWWMIIDAIRAPQIGEGVLATLGYAHRLITGVGNLVVAGPFAVLAPKFSVLVREQDKQGFKKFLIQSVLLVMLVATLFVIILWIYAEQLISFLFIRGSFTLTEAKSLSGIFRYMLPGLAAMVSAAITLRAAFCQESEKTDLALFGIMWGVSYYVLSLYFSDLKGKSLAIAYSLTWTMYFVALLSRVMVRK